MLNSGFDTYGPSLHLYKALFEDLLKAGHKIHLLESVSTRKDPVVPDSIEHHLIFSYELIPLTIANKNQFAKRYLVGVQYSFRARKFLKKCKGKFDVVHVQSCPRAPFLVSIVKNTL